MRNAKRLSLALWVALLALSFTLTGAGAAGGPPTNCTAELLIYTDPANIGSITQTGNVTHVRNSGTLGSYLSGVLSGYTIAGSQEIQINNVTNQSQLQGSFLATSADGNSSVVIKYSGHADLNTGAATGSFVAKDGTGELADFQWSGKIDAQLIGPLTFHATDSGPCKNAP